MEQIQFDPREGYYFSSCMHKSGLPIFDEECNLAAMVILTNCEESLVIANNLQHFSAWIDAAVLTDILKNRKWKQSSAMKKIFIKELKLSNNCKELNEPDIMNENYSSSYPIIRQQKPIFEPLKRKLRVITDCGVEVRLESGIIHSPIHFKDVNNSLDLYNLLQRDFKYRPNQKCEWLITAPKKNQKVGIRFQYFDLHPGFDRLDIEVRYSLILILHICSFAWFPFQSFWCP